MPNNALLSSLLMPCCILFWLVLFNKTIFLFSTLTLCLSAHVNANLVLFINHHQSASFPGSPVLPFIIREQRTAQQRTTLHSRVFYLFICLFIYLFICLFIYLWFTWNDPVNKEISNSMWANLKGFPGTNDLMPPLKDAKENLLLRF